jgi:hypothetical protein
MRRRTVIAGLLSTSALLATAACNSDSGSEGKSQAPAPPASPAAPASSAAPAAQLQPLPPGYHRVSDTQKGVSLGVPNAWTVIDVSANDLDASLKRAGLDDPNTRNQVQQLKSLGAVFVADPKSRAQSRIHFLTNVNAFCSPAPTASTEAFKVAARQQLQRVGATNVQIGDTTLDGRPAIRTNYVLKTAVGTVRGTQNAVLIDGKTCTITLSTDQPDRYRDVFDQVTATIDIG